jgi:hypothetical protein
MIAFAEDGKLADWAHLADIGLEGNIIIIAIHVCLEYHVKLTHVLVALVLDIIIYSIAAWYISAVFPGAYGIALPFYFFLMPSYWRGGLWDSSERPRSSGCIFSDCKFLLYLKLVNVHYFSWRILRARSSNSKNGSRNKGHG